MRNPTSNFTAGRFQPRDWFPLICILIIAACARFILLGEIPPGFYSDEASNAYDAYSLMLTGRDRYGVFFPLYSRCFDFWKASLHRFTIVPAIAAFGLSEFAARFPTALAGVGTVLLTYLTVRLRSGSSAALWAALLLAVAPWHFHVNRSCTEYTLLPFFFMAGLYFFYAGLERRKTFLYLSALSFGLCFYTYIPARIFVPLTGIALLAIYRKELSRNTLAAGISLLIFALLLLPSLFFAIREPDHFFLRYQQIPITGGGRSWPAALNLFLENYLANLSPVFLFFKGDVNVRHFPRGFGQLYYFELPLIILGIVWCLRKRSLPDSRFLIFWLLAYGVPASLTVENIPHALRTITAIPLYQILAGIGIACAVEYMRGVRAKKLTPALASLFVALSIANICIFARHYFLIYPVYSAPAWDYGWRDAIGHAKSVERNYDQIILTVLSVGPPTMYPPFYLKYDPSAYQKSELKETRYRFMPPEMINPLYPHIKGKNLYVVREEEIRGVRPLKTIYFPDGRVAFRIIEIIN